MFPCGGVSELAFKFALKKYGSTKLASQAQTTELIKNMVFSLAAKLVVFQKGPTESWNEELYWQQVWSLGLKFPNVRAYGKSYGEE